MGTQAKPDPRPVTTTVVQSLEPIDLDRWLGQYARAIVDAQVQASPQPRYPRLHQ